MVKDFSSHLTLLNVFDFEVVDQEDEKRKMVHYFKDVALSFEFLSKGKVVDKINDFITKNRSKLTVLVRHDLSFFKRLFQPSITRKMVLHPHCPLLILHG